MTALTMESDRERDLADTLRSLAVRRIEEMGTDAAADLLGMAETGVRSLLWKGTWSIETAFRVADALDLEAVRSWQGMLHEAAGNGSSNGNGAANERHG